VLSRHNFIGSGKCLCNGNDDHDDDRPNDFGMLCFGVTGICEKFAKIMYQYSIMCTRVPMELELSRCSWLTAAEQSFCIAVVKHCEHAKEIFLRYNLRYDATDLFLFMCVSGKFCQSISQSASYSVSQIFLSKSKTRV